MATPLVTELLWWLIQILYFILLGRIILTFFRVASQSSYPPMVEQVYRIFWIVTEPLLRPLRNMIPSIPMGAGYLDLSPIVLLLILTLIQNLILRI